MSSFARGLEAGSRIGQNFVEAYNRSQENTRRQGEYERKKAEWEKADAIERDVAAVPAAGSTRFRPMPNSSVSPELAEGLDRAYAAGGQDQVNNVLGAYAQSQPDANYSVMGLRKDKYTDADYATGLAGVYAKHGRPGEAFTMSNQARTSRKDAHEDSVMEMIRADAAGDIPAFIKASSKALTIHNSPLYPMSAEWNDQTGMVDTELWDAQNKQSQSLSLTRAQIIEKALASLSPDSYARMQTLGLARTKEAREQGESNWKRDYYNEQSRLEGRKLDITDRHYKAMEGIAAGKGSGGMTKAENDRLMQLGREVAELERMKGGNLKPHEAKAVDAEINARVREAQGLTGKLGMTGAMGKREKGLVGVQGMPGLMMDERSGQAYRLDEEKNEFVPVKLPGSGSRLDAILGDPDALAQVGRTMTGNKAEEGIRSGALSNMGRPNNFWPGANIYDYYTPPQAPDTRPQVYVPDLPWVKQER
jgi:hypothetical protein